MATENKDFKVKNGLQVGGPTNIVNYSSSSPSSPFIGQLWISASSLYAWTGLEWNLVGDGNSGEISGDFLSPQAAASVYFPISSSVSNFGTIKTIPATENIEADLITDELTFAAENGIILNATASVDQLTISTNATRNNTASAIVMRDGSGTFSVGAIDFDTGSSLPAEVGRMTWNASEGTLDVGISNNKYIHIGEDAVYRVRNSTESTILKGTALYASGVEPSGRIQVSPYVADGSIREVRFMGLATENINSAINGFVQHFGYVKDLDTRGTSLTSISVGDEDWSAGDILYVHPTQPGKLTNIKPQHEIIVALLIIRHQTSGVLFVRPSSGGHLEDIHDILITNASNNDILSYNVSSSVWFNQNLATAITEVDGAGSGIDADLLDGHHSSYFINTSSAAQIKYGDLEILGELRANELYVTGSVTYISTNNLQIEDSVIYISKNQFNEDVVDIGFIAPYGDETTSSAGSHYHTGLIRSHVDKKWRLLDNSEHPINNIFNFDSASTSYATLMVKTIEVSSSAVVTGLNSDLLDGYDSNYFLPSSTASAIYLSKSTASQTYVTKQDFHNLQVATIMGIF